MDLLMADQMTTSRSRVVVDICNTLSKITEEINRVFGETETYPYPLPKDFWEIKNKDAVDIFQKAAPFEGAANVLNKLSKEYEIVYLSSRPTWAREISQNWLKENHFPKGEIVLTKDKFSWVKKNGGVFMIEDDPFYVKDIQKLIKIYVHARPWNEDCHSRFNWSNVNF